MRGSQSPEFMIHASRIVQVETTSVTRTWFWYLEVWLKCVRTPKSIGLSGFIIMFPVIWLSFGVKKKHTHVGPQPKYDAKNGSAPCRSPPDPVMLVMLRQEIRGIQRAQSKFYGRKWMRAPVMTNKPSYIIVRHAWMNLQKHAGVISAYISVPVFGVTCLGSWFGTPRVFRTVPQNSIQIHALQYTAKSNIYMYIYILYLYIYQ